MNLPGTSWPIALAVVIGALVVLGLSFVVEGAAFLILGLLVGILVGGFIAIVSGSAEESRRKGRR